MLRRLSLRLTLLLLPLLLIPSLHLRLLHQHFLLDLIDLFLLLNLHLVNHSPILFPQLANIVHQLLIGLLHLLISLFQLLRSLCQLSISRLTVLQLTGKILLNDLVVALFELQTEVVTGLELVLLDYLEGTFS